MKYFIVIVLIFFIGCSKKQSVEISKEKFTKPNCFNFNDTDFKEKKIDELIREAQECLRKRGQIVREYSEELKREIEKDKPKKTIYDTKTEKLWINTVKVYTTKNPQICGKMTLGAGWRPIFVTIEKDKKNYGTYWAEPNIWDKEWCAIITNDLESGQYKVKVELIKKDKTKLSISENFEVKISK